MNSLTPNIVDVTIKEGGFRVHHRLLPEQVGDIARSLQDAGVQFAEISHGCGVGSFAKGYPGLCGDKDLLIASREAAPQLTILVYIYPSLHAVPEIRQIADYFDIGRIGINPNEIEMAQPHFEALESARKRTFTQLQRIHSFSPREVAAAAEKLETLGSEVIYLADTFGSLDEAAVAEYVTAVRERVAIPIGFQSRNTLGLAIANSLAAYQSGAVWLDASLAGFGVGAGMAPLEILASLLPPSSKEKTIDLDSLANTLRHHVRPIYHQYPHVTFPELVMAKHRVDYYPIHLLERIAEILDMPFDTLIADLRQKESFTQLRERELRSYLSKHQLDWDVVLEFLRTGRVPGLEE